MRVLPDSTERLLRAIDTHPSATGLLLVGGTALALRIGHRRSADLDFAFVAPRLPRKRIAGLLEVLRPAHRIEVLPNVAAEQDFLNSGLELADYQQDYSVDNVKVTFFVPDPASLGDVLKSERGVAGLKRIGVAELQSLFIMKAVTLNARITTRDLFDVYTLIQSHGCPAAEILGAADRFGYSSNTLKTRLLHAFKRLDDPGIETPTGVAPTFDQLKAYFAGLIDRLEQDEAAAAFGEVKTSGEADKQAGSKRRSTKRKK